MHALKIKFAEMKPAFSLVYLSSAGLLCVYSVQRYLGFPFDAASSLSFMGIIFGVYTLNRFTDSVEDFANDLGRFLFFQGKRIFFYLGILALMGSVGTLVAERKLNWMHMLLLTMGSGYSYRVIPWFAPGRGFHLVRIKEMIFMKNLCVSFLWGASVFVVPILGAGRELAGAFPVWMLAAGFFISTLNNTLFDDILDEPGDRAAGIRTLPTTWGARRSQFLLMILDAVWIALIAVLTAQRRLDGMHGAFLAFLGLYPFLYLCLNLGGGIRKRAAGWLAEADLVFFALGMCWLAQR
ncbi:MAG: UbiA family prenyltransferase [Fibrobacteres bacterium]|nr:UbiA family prenyltransferase [Fibrobacterota bacterium]